MPKGIFNNPQLRGFKISEAKRTGKYFNCKVCSKKIYRANWQIKKGFILCCSVKCKAIWRTGKKLNILKKNYHKKGIESPDWVGGKISYVGLHLWIRNNLGKPNKCDICETEKAKFYEWSNKDHKYKRDFKDWQRLCKSCHRLYDYKNHLVDIPSRWGVRKNKIIC